MKCDDPQGCQTPISCGRKCRYYEEPIHPNRYEQAPDERTIYQRYEDIRAQLAAAQETAKDERKEHGKIVQRIYTERAELLADLDKARGLLRDFMTDMEEQTLGARWMINGEAYKAAHAYLNQK